MSNLARKLQQQSQQHQQVVTEPKKVTVKKAWFTPGEKLLGIAFAGMLFFGAVHIVSSQAKIYQVNQNVQDIQTKISDQQRANSDLQVQVSQLSNYSRIVDKAQQMGLSLNADNVKVVPGK